ncbi:MAG: hypothetical protein ACM34A_12135 [Bacillota bacterium]
MQTNEQIRREMSYGIGAPLDTSEMKFTVTRRDPVEMQPWERVVLELIKWPRDEL